MNLSPVIVDGEDKPVNGSLQLVWCVSIVKRQQYVQCPSPSVGMEIDSLGKICNEILKQVRNVFVKVCELLILDSFKFVEMAAVSSSRKIGLNMPRLLRESDMKTSNKSFRRYG